MSKGPIDLVLAGLAVCDQDLEDRRHILEQAGRTLLRRPPLGAQIVARVGAMSGQAPELNDLADLLTAALYAARMARESGQRRGDVFLQVAGEAVEIAARRGNLETAHRLILARAWTQSGLPAPEALAFTSEDFDPPKTDLRTGNRKEAEAALENLFRELIQQAGDDPQVLHAALTDSFPVMPAEMRDHVVAYSVALPEQLHEELACFWLLDPSPAIRLSAARALAERLRSGPLSGQVRASLVLLRSWMPKDAARARLDEVMRGVMRSGAPTPAAHAPAKVIDIQMTLPDGGGAQSIAIALTVGRQRRTAMLLMKQGHGVKDAYVIPCSSAREQKALMQQMAAETGALTVPLSFVERALSMALADGLERGLPPAAGLIQIAASCGFTDLRPQPMSSEALLVELACAQELGALSRPARSALVEASETWLDNHDIVQSWFEESDGAHEPFDLARGPRALKSALWTWLETRRGWWALIMARSAATLEAAGHPDAASFAATAMALMEGRKLKTIPVMADIHDQTVEAWLFNGPPMDEDILPVGLPPPAAPEAKGELARLLKGGDLSPDWIDGYLMAAVIAPKMLTPDRWLQPLLNKAVGTLLPAGIQRFLDIVMMRANAAIALMDDEQGFQSVMTKRSKPGRHDWAAGFTAAHEASRPAWPAKALAPDDRAMLKLIAEGARVPFTLADIEMLGTWIKARNMRNRSV